MSEVVSKLKEQGVAILVMLGIAIIAPLAIIILEEFRGIVPAGLGNGSQQPNLTIQLTLTTFQTAFVLVGTFATVTMLVIVVKAVIGVVKGLGKS